MLGCDGKRRPPQTSLVLGHQMQSPRKASSSRRHACRQVMDPTENTGEQCSSHGEPLEWSFWKPEEGRILEPSLHWGFCFLCLSGVLWTQS